MIPTERLESITTELYDFSKNYIKDDACLGREFEDAANAIKHLISVYNYGYDGYEIDILNKYVSQKLTSLQRVIKVRSTKNKDDKTIYVLGSLNNYTMIIKTKN